MKTIVISNRKGGTGKTTTSINLSAQLAKKNSVLLIDLDTQGHASVGVGHGPLDEGGTHQIFFDKTLCEYFLPTMLDNLTLAPASAFFDVYETGDLQGKLKKAYIHEQLSEFFDYCIIDTPPTFDTLLKNALEVSDCVIIPTLPHQLGFIGVEQVFRAIYKMSIEVRGSLPFVGILPVMYNSHIEEHKKILKKLEESFGKEKFFSPIRVDIELSTEFERQVPLVLDKQEKRGAKDYIEFTKDLMERINE
ncbi:MAG: ParA family protein [Campylobacterales bacterium]|nr:ParA family protein [Campylobacterales bacterium]